MILESVIPRCYQVYIKVDTSSDICPEQKRKQNNFDVKDPGGFCTRKLLNETREWKTGASYCKPLKPKLLWKFRPNTEGASAYTGNNVEFMARNGKRKNFHKQTSCFSLKNLPNPSDIRTDMEMGISFRPKRFQYCE